MYKVILTSLFFLMANIGGAYSYIKSDDTAERIEFQSLMGTQIWDRNQKEHNASGYLWMPDKEAFPGMRPLVILLPGMGGWAEETIECAVFLFPTVLRVLVLVFTRPEGSSEQKQIPAFGRQALRAGFLMDMRLSTI